MNETMREDDEEEGVERRETEVMGGRDLWIAELGAMAIQIVDWLASFMGNGWVAVRDTVS
jgi:hypothetical protein